MKFRIVSLVLYTVVLAALASAQQTTYTMYTGEKEKGIHVPTFFTTGPACLAAKEFKIYEPRDITRLGAWQERLENKEAGIISYPFDTCAEEDTAMGIRIIKLPPDTPLFTVAGKVAADGRCGNNIRKHYLPPQPEAPAPPPPPPVRVPEPQPEAPAPPPPPPVVFEPPAHACPTCSAVEVQLVDKKGRLLRLVAHTSEYVQGSWYIGDQLIGQGNSLVVSNERLTKLVGKTNKTGHIQFRWKDIQGHDGVCEGEVILKQGKKGRFWLFRIPVINCFYAYTVDIKNWSLEGTIEKVACAALGVGTWYTLTHTGAAALIGSKPPVRVISPP